LLSVELKKYVSSTLYVINTSFGVVMMVVVTTVFLVMGPDVIEKIMFAGEEMPFVISTENYAAIATLISLFFAAMTATTPASISFEGKRLWILRSMPVRAFEVLRAKLMLNVLLFVPAQIICSAAVMIRLGVHPGPGIAMVLLPAGTNLVVAGGGLILNLLMPKLDWRNEAQVLKQSISVLLTMLIGFGLASLPIIIYFVFFFSSGDGTVAMTVTAYSITLLYAVLFTVELLILAFPGKRMFERLSA
jgi:ABC-2 type transport system permease protein